MKLTPIEKKMIIATIILIFTALVLVSNAMNGIKEAGGMKQIIIEAGKEIKDIQKEIDKENK